VTLGVGELAEHETLQHLVWPEDPRAAQLLRLRE
jgi:hypothetical protein